MEAEFLRRYLENWGWADPSTIQENLSQLIGSEVLWRCGDQNLFSTRVNGIIRLSHEASNRLWLEPRNIDEILRSREGLPSEWIGNLPLEDERDLIIGFCGWGPFSLGEARFTYFRYLISFEVLEHYR